ncbi:MAG: sulfatase-like hydrolase/transferase, partial [Proteobacteria bacterium]|nr:sulfatase-like hydrolase/transferase [Pseudomonadota bacterium]
MMGLTQLVLVVGLGCGGQTTNEPAVEDPGPPPADLPDVVLISLDTLRADRIGIYGYEKAATQNIDALAAKGRVYGRTYSPLPLTIPSHGSIFTGQYPPTLQIRSNGAGRLEEERLTLAEILQQNGYVTGGSVGAFVTTRTWGFNQGFDAFFDTIPQAKPNDFWHAERPAEKVIDDILDWKAEVGDQKPIFAWIHLYDAHFPYWPPKSYIEEVKGRPYDGEIAYLDDQLQRVFDAFARPTLFIIVGDHGEGLGEHLELTHGMYVYDTTQHVPLIISGPGVEAGVVEQPTSLVDIMPTVLSLLGLPAVPDLDGRVVPGDEPQAVYMESYQLTQRFGLAPNLAVVDGNYKLLSLPKPELYDLIADPEETKNLAEDKPSEVKRLQDLLDAFEFNPPYEDPAHPVEPDVAMQLQALGYVEGGFTGDMSGPLPDPKDHADMVVDSQRAERLIQEEKRDEAIELLNRLVKEYPEVIEFKSRLAMLYGIMGKMEESADLLEAAVEQDPSNAMLRFTLGVHRARSNRYREASILFRDAAEAMPFSPRARTMAVAALLDAEDGREEAYE